MEIDLKKQIGRRISKTAGTRKLTLMGETKAHEVYRIPLDLVHYNERNGRIATYISQYITEGNEIDKSSLEDYNTILQKFIEDSNPKAITKTKNNLDQFGQIVPAVVLNDGRIIDGNRRFTCLRKLKNEGRDVFLEAVILDQNDGIDDRDIKRLELNLQHAEDKPVDYNPIDNLVDIYRDLVENDLFTIAEYAVNTNKKQKEIELLLKKSELMNQFLDFINASKQYFIARDMELDGPLQELVSIFNKHFKGKDLFELNQKNYMDKQEQGEYLQMRNALFATIFTTRNSDEKGDLTRQIRQLGKDVLGTSNKQNFLEKYENVVEVIYEAFHEQEKVTPQTVREVGRKLEKVREKGKIIIEEEVETTQIFNAKSKPVELMKKALKDLEGIDLEQVKRLDNETNKEFNILLKKIEKLAEKMSNRVHV